MRNLIVGVAITTALGPALAQDGRATLQLAWDTGIVIGAATACGLSEERAALTWRRVRDIGLADQREVNERQFTATHLDAVKKSADRQSRRNGQDCAGAIAAFQRIENEVTVRR